MEKLFKIGDLDLIRDIPVETEELVNKIRSMKVVIVVITSIGILSAGIWLYNEIFIHNYHEGRE